MEPKIKVVIKFVEKTGNKAVIASIKKAKDAAPQNRNHYLQMKTTE